MGPDADSLRLWTEGVGATSRGLRTIKGQIGVLHEVLGIGAVLWCQCDADAGARSNWVSEYIVRFSERSHQAFGQLRCLSFACGAVLEDCKFIAAEASREIGIPQNLAQTLGNALQQGIPNGMSEGVIHFFEVVEIDPVKGESAPGLQRPGPIFQLLAELMPIGNLGQRIMARQPIDFLFGLTLLRYVLLNINPSATSERLVADQDDAAALEELRMRERFSPCQLCDVVLDPLALLFEFLRIIAACLP